FFVRVILLKCPEKLQAARSLRLLSSRIGAHPQLLDGRSAGFNPQNCPCVLARASSQPHALRIAMFLRTEVRAPSPTTCGCTVLIISAAEPNPPDDFRSPAKAALRT